MRRVVAAALLTSVLSGASGVASAAGPATKQAPPAAQPSAQPPLSLENAKPLAPPPHPRLQTPALPPAPKPLETPDLMAFPDVPTIATPAPVAAPVNPVGAPPPAPRRAAPPPAPAVVAPISPPPPPGVSVEERVAGAAPKLAAPPSSGATPAALPPLSVGSMVFAPGSAALPESLEPTLKALAEHMRAQPTSRLQLRAYAMGDVDSERQARQLSLARALAVRERLTALGVRSTRIDVRPLGVAAPPSNPDVRDRVDVEFTSE